MADENFKPYGRVYLVTNLVNGKRYVGQTVLPLSQRWKKHCGAYSGCHALAAAIRKYGEHSFSIAEIAVAHSAAELNDLEAALVVEYRSMWPYGYNLKAGGGSIGKMSEATRERMKVATAASWQDDEYRSRQLAKKQTASFKKSLSVASSARWANPEYRAATMARLQSPEYQARMRAISTARWLDAGYRGKQLAWRRAPENIEAQRARAIARWQDDDFRKRHAELMAADEYKHAHLEGVRRVARSPERIRKLSEGKKMHWQDPAMRASMLSQLEASAVKRAEGIRRAYEDPALLELRSKQSKAMWESAEYRAKMSAPEMIERKRFGAAKANTPEKLEKASADLKQKWEDPTYRAKMMEMIHSPEVKAKRQEAQRRRWEKYRAAKAAAQN